MQGALMGARCCDAQVFANAEAGEDNVAPNAPFRPGKTPGMAKPCRMTAGCMRKPLGAGAFLRFGRNPPNTIARSLNDN